MESYPFSARDIEKSFNNLLDALEDNQQEFANRVEKAYPDLTYQGELYKLRAIIRDLEAVRENLKTIKWY